MEDLEMVACALCGKDDTSFLFLVRDLHFTTDPKRDRVFRLVQCRACGLVYVNPRPALNKLLDYHPADSYYAYRPIEEPRGARDRVKAAFKIWTAQAHFRYPGSTVPLVQGLKWALTYPIKHKLARIVPHNAPGRLLDVGCGSGAFLHWMRERSTWEVQGVEPSPAGSAYARDVLGLNVTTGTLLDAKFPPNHFDAVTFWDSFMHVPNPFETLTVVRRIMKPGGVAYLVMPNIESYEARVFSRYWFMLDVPRHLYHYSPQTIGRMIERGGLRLRRITFPGGWSALAWSVNVWRMEFTRYGGDHQQGPPALLRLVSWIPNWLGPSLSRDWRMRVEAVKT